MYDLQNYISGAVSTESVKDKIKVNKQFLQHVLKLHTASGNMLDQVKKHTFYGREYDHRSIDKHIMNISDTLKDMQKMTFDELVDKEDIIDINPRIFHAMIGTATEAVELMEALDLDGGTLDLVNISEEYGDLNWYQAIFCDESEILWDDILNINAEKLFKANQARFRKGFNDSDANKRNLEAEREVLETIN